MEVERALHAMIPASLYDRLEAKLSVRRTHGRILKKDFVAAAIKEKLDKEEVDGT